MLSRTDDRARYRASYTNAAGVVTTSVAILAVPPASLSATGHNSTPLGVDPTLAPGTALSITLAYLKPDTTCTVTLHSARMCWAR